MKRILLVLLCSLCCFCSCGKQEVHWSHKACVETIVKRHSLSTYSYSVKEIEHDEVASGNDEVYCFDITIKSGDFERRYCCFAVVSDGNVIYTDCDVWGGDD